MKDVLCTNNEVDDEVWLRVIQEVDIDGNGEIDFQEFCQMMSKMIFYDESDKAD